MMNKRKWITVITEEQYDWIKETAEAAGLKGSDVVREAIDRSMKNREFRASLAQTQLKIQLDALNDKKAALESQTKDLQKRLKETALVN